MNIGKTEPFAGMCDAVKLVATRLSARGVPLPVARGVVIDSALCSWAQGLVCDRAQRKACGVIIESWIDRLTAIWKAREASEALAVSAGATVLGDAAEFQSEARAVLAEAAATRQGPPPRWYRNLEIHKWHR